MHIDELSQPSQIADLVRDIERADGVSALNELGEHAMRGLREAVVLGAFVENTLAGFALIQARESSVQMGVHPDFRRQGIGRQLAAAAMLRPHSTHWWAFGDSPRSRGFADAVGLTLQRELLIMARDVEPFDPMPFPDGVTLDQYRDADSAGIVDVNATAFANHPEQGNLSLDDFLTLTRQDWFDPRGLLVAREHGRIVGFHWTKRHDDTHAEVYVIAVHPDTSGKGLGRALLEAGLAHLAGLGVTNVKLYVESSSNRAVNMYEAAKFKTIHIDASYAVEGHHHV